ncbi:uncharacterized protein LOC144543528 [Centroberyx gerrardi]
MAKVPAPTLQRELKVLQIDYLSLLGGKTPGDSVRRIMRKLGTNALWANYSLKGRKGKKKFQDLGVYEVIIHACRQTHPKVTEHVFDSIIGETLKYAPHRRTLVDNRNPVVPSTSACPGDSP